MLTPDAIRTALATVKYPGFNRDIISFGLVKDIQFAGPDVTVQMVITTADAAVPAQIKTAAEAALSALPGIGKVSIRIDIHAPAQAPAAGGAMPQTSIPGVKHVIAIASG
jgi:ATP-binding protein involved in chromosome partitioning